MFETCVKCWYGVSECNSCVPYLINSKSKHMILGVLQAVITSSLKFMIKGLTYAVITKKEN